MNQPALASARPSTVKRPWLRQLWAQVLLAMIAGILLGVLRPELAGRMQPLGDGFIRAIRMLIAPIVFCSVVHGVARRTFPQKRRSGISLRFYHGCEYWVSA